MGTNFSTLLSAVKPKDRTDQYVVLAALYSLNATVTSVTAAQVRERIVLHLGKKTPKNIPNCLRKYSTYVEPAEKGPPLKWKLKSEGVVKLKALSDLPLSASPETTPYDYDIAVICALEQPEFDAVAAAFGESSPWNVVGDPSFTHVYRETSILTAAGKPLRVVATVSTSMGLTAAAIATTQLILQFRPRIVAMIGIAAGTRAGNKQFGDVLVADPSVDYNSGKVVDVKGIREFLPDPYPIGLNPRLRSVLQRYASNQNVFEEIRKLWAGKLPDGKNRLHIGPLGAADQVIDDPTRVLEITKNWRKLVGVEMETYAVYRACLESPDPKPRMISFKAVCDFAAEKTDSWQGYAAFTAARFAAAFFKSEWDALWPLEKEKSDA